MASRLKALPITPADVASVIGLIEAGSLNDKLARQVFEGVLAGEGTPDEVVAQPADDYVKDFVSEVPKAHVLTLKWVMREPRLGEAMDGPTLPVTTVVRQAARAAIASSAVDMPTRSAPMVRSIRISAGVS